MPAFQFPQAIQNQEFNQINNFFEMGKGEKGENPGNDRNGWHGNQLSFLTHLHDVKKH